MNASVLSAILSSVSRYNTLSVSKYYTITHNTSINKSQIIMRMQLLMTAMTKTSTVMMMMMMDFHDPSEPCL